MNTLLDDAQTDSRTDSQDGRIQHRIIGEDSVQSGEAVHSDREFTLGTTTILGLFFALALLCAIFFGFGYSLGSRSSATPVVATTGAPAPIFASKPSPGSPVLGSAKASSAAPPAPLETVTVPVVNQPAATPVSAPATPATSALASSDPTHPAAAILASAVQPIVQVAAVSHQEDAELIASTLKRRGYAVTIRNEPQDKLLHIQLGPFPNRKDAEAMRERLLADGFNAYIK